MVCRERFSQIGRALRTKKSDDRDAINAVSELIAEVGIGKRLGDVGATSAHYGAWAQAALEDICLRSNPRTASWNSLSACTQRRNKCRVLSGLWDCTCSADKASRSIR